MSQEDADKCAVATNAAMEVAMDECSPQAMLENLSRMVGLADAPDPMDVADELDAVDCMDMDTVRAWVVVRADELIDDGEGLSDAIQQAWDEVEDDCGW